MTWLEAQALLESGTSVRRSTWVRDSHVRQEGERLLLWHRPFADHYRGKPSNAVRDYSPSLEAIKADDWEIAG